MKCGALAACLLACGAAPPAPPPAAPVVPEMVPIAGGRFVRGREDSARRDETPPHLVALSPFAIDRTLVTRAAFARFVAETGYVTRAERDGYGIGASLGMEDWAWERIPHASWRRPFAEATPDHASFLRDDAPVVMVAWTDADAFCRHHGKRLPTEAEWEFAMRAGREGARFPWGESPEIAPSVLGLNFWQGTSHRENLRTDGWVYVSPVSAFPPNAWGLHDPVGNVWQWTADVYAADTYATLARAGAARDPKGPADGAERVLRGGSWWCGRCTCEGYGLHYRGHADPRAAFNNNGFRCAR